MRLDAFVRGIGLASILPFSANCARQQLPATTTASVPMATQASPVAALSALAVASKPAMHEIRMVGDGRSYRFVPETLTVVKGDSVRFLMVSGGPHNVSFKSSGLSEHASAALADAMPDQTARLASPYFLQPGETYTIAFAGVDVGTYGFYCIPHMAMEQRGQITVVAR